MRTNIADSVSNDKDIFSLSLFDEQQGKVANQKYSIDWADKTSYYCNERNN